MAAEEKKKERLLSPVGAARYASVITPHVYKEGGQPKGDPYYTIDVLFKKDDPLWAPWAEAIVKRVRSLPDIWDNKAIPPVKLPKRYPIKNVLDAEDKPTGELCVTFTSPLQYKPDVFDKYGRPVPGMVKIGNGSKVQVAYTPSEHGRGGGGLKLFLNAVFVIELLEFNSNTAESYGFKVEKIPEGGAPPLVPGEEGGAKAQPPAPEDDLPF